MKNMILASSSSVYGSEFLEYLLPQLRTLFEGVSQLLFIPYARPGGITHDEYTSHVEKAFNAIGIKAKGIHTFPNPKEAIENAEAIYTGGGNTFVLVDKLYEYNLMDVLKETIENGTPYLGTSAGTNICGVSMKTTNDMPIVELKKYTTLGLISFNINAHYIEPKRNSTHKGETRETRIKEFHAYNNTPVIGLKEGSWLSVNGNQVVLKGDLNAMLFEQGKRKKEVVPETDFSLSL